MDGWICEGLTTVNPENDLMFLHLFMITKNWSDSFLSDILEQVMPKSEKYSFKLINVTSFSLFLIQQNVASSSGAKSLGIFSLILFPVNPNNKKRTIIKK